MVKRVTQSMVFMADDAVWSIGELRDGSEGAAAKGPFTFPVLDGRASNRFGASLRAEFERPLKEGEFLAKIEGQGFTPSGGLRLNHHDSANLVRGEVER